MQADLALLQVCEAESGEKGEGDRGGGVGRGEAEREGEGVMRIFGGRQG